MKRISAIAATLLACYGGPRADENGGSGDAGEDADDDAADDDAGSSGGDMACDAALAAVDLRRLTNTEMRNSIRDLFGPGLEGATAALPPDSITGGFDNNAESFALTDTHVERYRDAAESIARSVVEDAARRDAVIGCDATAECLDAFVRRFARLAWRRTPADEEIAALLAVAAAAAEDPDPWMATRLVLEAILQSPNFLLRVEIGEPDPDDPARLRLTGPEVATRLSYLLLASTPPEWLIDAAEAGELVDADGIEATAHMLLADERARAGLRNFHAQWLQLPLLAGIQRDPAVYPAWTAALPAAMAEETARYVDDFVWGEDADFLDVLVAPYGYVDADLAAVYGVPAPADGLARVDFAPDQHRGGLLTQASALTVTGKNESGLPIFRGKFVREVLLCQSLPPPPADVPTIPEPVPGESDRERLDRHRTDPACNGCHALLDPLGFGLADYDAIGALRTTDSSGAPVSAEGSFDGFDRVDFDGALELSELLREDPAVAACVVRQLFRYATARRESDEDACALDHLGAAFEDGGHSLVAALIAHVRSDVFRSRPLHEEGP